MSVSAIPLNRLLAPSSALVRAIPPAPPAFGAILPANIEVCLIILGKISIELDGILREARYCRFNKFKGGLSWPKEKPLLQQSIA